MRISQARFSLTALVLAVLVFLQVGQAQQFQKAVNYRTHFSPFAVTSGDFNGDAIPDVVTASYGPPSTVGVLIGNGDGTFQTEVIYDAGEGLAAVAVGDFNGDGKSDLVLVEFFRGVSVMLGNGDGSFQAAVMYPAGPDPFSVVIGDFNGDGKADLAVPNVKGDGPLNGSLAILLGNGDGSFQAPVHYAAGISPNSVAVGDFNGDGILDLVVGNSSSSLAILLGNGDGTFQKALRYSGPGSAARWVAVGDLNNDGKLDVVAVLPAAGNRTNARVVVGLGHGDGSFAAPVAAVSGKALDGVVVADFNGDGNADLAISAGTVDGKVVLLKGNGDGSFQAPEDYRTLGSPLGLAAADLNADGFPDLAVVAAGMSVLLNTGTNGVASGPRLLDIPKPPD